MSKGWRRFTLICFVFIYSIIVIGFAVILPLVLMKDSLPLENVVQIKCEMVNEDYYGYTGWQGSGVFIADNLILTAGHIVDKVGEIEIIEIDGDRYKAINWYKEPEADIGFIVVDTNDVEKKLKFDNAKLGEDVWAYGNPFGVFSVLTKGIISAINASDDFKNTKNMVIVDAAINGGNSGCPIFDKSGNILGICSWGYRYSQGMSYFVRSEVIELSLKKYKVIMALREID